MFQIGFSALIVVFLALGGLMLQLKANLCG